MKLRNIKWWRVLIGVLWIPIAAELWLRVFAPVPMLPRFIEAGPHGVRTNMPGRTYRHQTPEYKVEIRTNAQGLRADEEFDRSPGDDTIRIVVLGDSFGMGYGVNLEESSLHLLERRLAEATGCEVEILNFSVSGFGPAEQLIVLEAEAIDFDPDLVVQYYFSNDPTDDLRSSLFRLEDGELKRGNSNYLPAVKIREFLFSFAVYRWLASESNLYNFFRDKAGANAKYWLAKYRSWARPAPPPLPVPVETPEAEDETVPHLLTLAILDRMRRMTQDAGAEFLILSIPIRRARDRFTESFPERDPFSLPVVSPLDRFNAAEGRMLYWERSHGHWTPLGCRLVADELADAILNGPIGRRACD